MSHKNTFFYRERTATSMDSSADEVSSDGAVLLLEKLERKHRILQYFSQVIPDRRDPIRIVCPIEKLRKQRVFTLMQGYEDANDVQYLTTHY